MAFLQTSITLIGILALGVRSTARADTMLIAGLPNIGNGEMHVTSFAERRFRFIVRQQSDFTCGAAAVATILRYGFGLSVDEPQVTRALLAIAGERARRTGFSLLEIKEFLHQIGYNGDGYRLPLLLMPQVVLPTIALISVDGYEHFVVIRRVTASTVYVADPVVGNRSFSVDQFESIWTNKIIFRIQGPGYRADNGLAHFELPETTATLAQSIPPGLDPLSNATLTSIGALPPSSRL